MLYLFNSASRPIYLRNILNTLYLPHGAHNQHRWKPKNIEPAILESLRGLAPETRCLVIYACLRDGEPPLYIPLREVSLAKYPVETDRQVVFEVFEGDYVCPTDLAAFQPTLASVLDGRRPPSEMMDDRHYVIDADDIASDGLVVGPDAWQMTVDLLGDIPAFQDPANPVVFVRAELDEAGTPITARDRSSLRPGMFPLHSGKTCQLQLTYRAPGIAAASSYDAEITVEAKQGDLAWESESAIPIDGYGDVKRVEFKIHSKGVYNLRLKAASGGLILPTETIDLDVCHRTGFWIELGAWAIFYFAATAVGLRTDTSIAAKTVVSFLQPLFVIWAIRLFGKNPL